MGTATPLGLLMTVCVFGFMAGIGFGIGWRVIAALMDELPEIAGAAIYRMQAAWTLWRFGR